MRHVKNSTIWIIGHIIDLLEMFNKLTKEEDIYNLIQVTSNITQMLSPSVS